tara:strand:+ start:182 stop:598 length:417 start_codon:yes stop_codon:yes gene_type:complete
MKKLLGIVVLGLLLSGNAYAADIKFNRIECKDLKNNRFYNKFFIISENQKEAKLYRSFGNFGWNIVKLKVSTTLNVIEFTIGSEVRYSINRSTGDYRQGILQKFQGTCIKMEDDFDPEAFLSEIVKKNIENKKKQNKF